MFEKRCYTFLVAITLCIALFIAMQPSSHAEVFTGTVISVTDGDTIIVSHEGQPEKIRLLSVDSPEKSQAFGRAAKKALSDLVFMQQVTINSTGKDKYGRTLGVVIRNDGLNANEELVSSGYAWVYRARTKDKKLVALETAAKESKRGLWSDATAMAPWDYRKIEKETRRKSHPANIADPDGLIKQLLRERVPAKSKAK